MLDLLSFYIDMRNFVAKLFSKVEYYEVSYDSSIVFLSLGVIGLVLIPQLWKISRYGITYVHEFGHGITSLLTGGGLSGIRIHADTSGLAYTSRRRGFIGWISGLLTTYIGYPFAGLLASFMMFSVNKGWVTLVFLGLLLLSVFTFFFMRNLFGILVGLSVTTGMFIVYWFVPPVTQSIILLITSIFLTFGGLRTVIELIQHHLRGKVEQSDVYALTKGFFPFTLVVFASYFAIYAFPLLNIWKLLNS